VFTKAFEPSLGGGHGSGDRMSRGWAALAMTDARREVQNTHTSLTLYMLCSYHCARPPARKKKNKKRTNARSVAIQSPRSGQRIALKNAKSEPIFARTPNRAGAWPRISPHPGPQSPESDHRLPKPWTTHTDFRTHSCKFMAGCGPKALTSKRALGYTKPSSSRP
jgi:hypothetical protein